MIDDANQKETIFVVKRDMRKEAFDPSKIRAAIERANKEEKRKDIALKEEDVDEVVEIISAIASNIGRNMSVEEIQDIAEREICKRSYEVFLLYHNYRFRQQEKRQISAVDARIKDIIDVSVQEDGSVACANEDVKQENSNKNPTILSVQRDYIAGEWCRHYSNGYMLPDDIRRANEEGIIHFHDMDFYPMQMHNCFSRNTRFLTDKGARAFSEFRDGDAVTVIDKDGQLRQATVHCYGRQRMKKIKLKTTRMERELLATPDHRWILNDGSVTTALKVGDRLLGLKDTTCIDLEEIRADCRKAELFALGFILGDGNDYYSTSERGHVGVRLCGEKMKYIDIFLAAQYQIGTIKNSRDVYMHKPGAIKQEFLSSKGWRYMHPEDAKLVFSGYMAADGCSGGKHVITADTRIGMMIEELSASCGYYISRKKTGYHDTNYKKNAFYIEYGFIRYQRDNSLWKVVSIEEANPKAYKYSAWCVEEPITHSFMLEGGIITGNCCLVNLEDMLQNGTCISGTMIEKPKSFATACTVTSQIAASVASSQYGGQTMTLSHLAPFVNVSRQKIRERLRTEWKDTGVSFTEEQLFAVAEKEVEKEVASGCQTIQYQLVTLHSTNGQAPFITLFMYLDEVEDGQLRKDLALIIKTMLQQRIYGIKDRSGVLITPAFPKLIYVLEEDNIRAGSEYFWLTKLAAECTAKRMVPDYISEKKMKELKGDVYPCMGCRSFLTPDRFTDKGAGNIANAKDYRNVEHKYYGRLTA